MPSVLVLTSNTTHHTFTAMKFNPLSVARARAIMVLLQPGGPYNSTPRGGAIPSRAKACGDQTGVRKLLASAHGVRRENLPISGARVVVINH